MDAPIDDLLKYSFQYNVKFIGLPEQDEHESAESTTQLCLKLFHAIGVTKNDIDIAHRVNSRRSDSHYPRPIVCKFIRRLAKEEVMVHRNATSNLNPDDLNLSADFHTENIGIHEHLIPRLQHLLSEANKLKSTHQFQYVWVKNSEILPRKSSSSQVFKLKHMGDFNLDLLKYENCKYSQTLLQCMQRFPMLPTIDKPTRVYGSSATLIDNIFPNNLTNNISSGNIVTNTTDHFSQVCIANVNKQKLTHTKKTKFRDYSS